jgi:hypothetical protein
MLDLIRPYLEADTANRGKQALTVLRATQLRNKTFWFLYLGTSVFSFTLLLAGFSIAERSPSWRLEILLATLVAAFASLAIGERMRMKTACIQWTAGKYLLFRTWVSRQLALDYLAGYTWATYFFVLGPSCISVLLVILNSHSQWILPGSNEHRLYAETLKQLMTLAGAVLAAQVALFNFMFGQLLGKYSSTIAAAVAGHRSVTLLRGFIITTLIILYCAFCLGFPVGLPGATIWILIAVLNTVLLTVRVATKGIETDSAIRYAGFHIAQRIRRRASAPLKRPSAFWKVMAAFGLDWRNPERMVALVPPMKPASESMRMAAGIFNAAHKFAEDNQHEMFFAALEALRTVADAYAQGRKKYFGTGDSFLDYLINQFSTLLKVSAKSANETLVTNVITCCGAIGKICLSLGEEHTSPEREPDYPKGHPWFVHWFGFLNEGFDLSHTLMRSTAASEAISQMTSLTNTAIEKNFAENAMITYLPQISQIHAKCLLVQDPYHLSLAGECVISTMNVWMFSVAQPNTVWAHISDSMTETVKEIALRHQKIQKLPSFDLLDSSSALTVKVAEDRYTIQDICFALMHRKFAEDWEKRHALDVIIDCIEMITELATNLTPKEWAIAKAYIEALYEISFLTFRELPATLTSLSKEEVELNRIAMERSRQQKLEDTLSDSVGKLLDWSDTGEWAAFSTEQVLFSILGLAAASYKISGRDSLKSLASTNIKRYFEGILKDLKADARINDARWDYLQLCAAWCFGLLDEPDLGTKLVEHVANYRPFKFGYVSGSSGRYGSLGYPQGELGMDFFVVVPRNIVSHLTNSDMEQFESLRALAMDDQILVDTYRKVEHIRGPIRDRLLEERRQRFEQQRQAKEREKKGAT